MPNVTVRNLAETPNIRGIPPDISRLAVRDDIAAWPDGTVRSGILVTFQKPTYYDIAGCDIWYRPSLDATDPTAWTYSGRTRDTSHKIASDLLEAATSYEVAVCPVSLLGASKAPTAAVRATITFNGIGGIPNDIAGFDVATDKGDVYFTWTANLIHTDIAGYEIRAGATGWLSATVVGVFGPRTRNFAKVPRVRATGTSFYIKAITTTLVYSSAVGTATLTAAEGTELDNTSVVGYQDVTVLAGATTVVVTTKATYTAEPFITVEQKQSGATALGIYKHHIYNFVLNGDSTYSFTLKISDTAPTGGVKLSVHEAGAM